MNTLGPILAATDLSAHARHAADRAARLAHETGSPLTLLHVLPGEPLAQLRAWLGAGSPAEQQLRSEAERALRELAAQLQAARHTAAPRTEVAAGQAIDEIVRAADAIDAGLLVMGARGAGFLRRLVLGTTSERLMRRTTRPLLVVRQTPHEHYRRVLVALDFSPWSAQALAVARRVAPHAQLILASVFEVPFADKLSYSGVDAGTVELYRRHTRDKATARVHALAAASGLKHGSWQPGITEGDASTRLLELEQQHDCDLVVLGKHGQSATTDLLLGSVTKHVLAEGSADVLVSTQKDAG